MALIADHNSVKGGFKVIDCFALSAKYWCHVGNDHVKRVKFLADTSCDRTYLLQSITYGFMSYCLQFYVSFQKHLLLDINRKPVNICARYTVVLINFLGPMNYTLFEQKLVIY